MLKVWALAAILIFVNTICYSEDPTFDQFNETKTLTGYPHSLYIALYHLGSVFESPKLYYKWTARRTSYKDLISMLDVDPSEYKSWVLSQLPISQRAATEVINESAADALVIIEITEKLTWPNRTYTNLLLDSQVAVNVQIVDKASSIVLGRNQLIHEKVTIIADSPRNGELKLVRFEWNDSAVRVHLSTTASELGRKQSSGPGFIYRDTRRAL